MVRNGVDTMLCDFCSVIWVLIVKKCNQVWVNDGSNYDSQGSQIPHHVFGVMARWWHTLKEYNAKQKNTASPLQVNSSSLSQPSDSSWGYRRSTDARESECYPVKNKHSLAGNVFAMIPV